MKAGTLVAQLKRLVCIINATASVKTKMDWRAYYRDHTKLAGLAALTLIAILVTGWAIWGRSDDPNYLTAEVQRGGITSVVQATGTINPLTTVPVGSYVSGTVQYVFADFNSRVEAGQVLAQLDPEVYQAQVVQARGNLENAIANEKNLEATITAQEAAIKTNEANLERLKAAAVYSQANTRRILDLDGEGVFSKDQADQAQSGLDQSQAQVRAAEAQLNQSVAQLAETHAQVEQAKAQVKTMQGALALADANLRYCTIISPIDGTVVPSAAAGSLPFLPQPTMRVLRTIRNRYGSAWTKYGFVNAFNPVKNWYDNSVIGIDTGITMLMAENARTGFVWDTFMKIPEARRGMERAGFKTY